MTHFLRRVIENIENSPLTLSVFSVTFFALIIARLIVENTLALFQERTLFFFFFEFTHTFLFFLCSFILLLSVVRLAGNSNLKQSINILLFGFLIILTPPIIDRWIMGAGNYWSFYEFDGIMGLISRYFTLFGDTPNIGITYGVRFEVVLVTILLGLYTWIKSKKIWKSLGIALLTYSVLFVLGTFPSWLTLGILIFQKSFLAISGNDVAALFLTPETILSRNLTDLRGVLNFKMSIVYGAFATLLTGIFLYREYPKIFFALLRNARFPQLVYHGGLLFLGMFLMLYFTDTSFRFDFFHVLGILVLLIAVECAWLASVIVNDIYDTDIDAVTNTSRPLIKNSIPIETYRVIGVLFFTSSLLLSAVVNFSSMYLLLAYQAIAWLYSAPPFRLKRLPIIATGLAAAAGIAVLISGYLAVAPVQNISDLPLPLLVFLFIAYTLSLPIKDFKDYAGDKADQVYTLPVIFGIPIAKQVLGGILFLLYIASPFVLHARSLFFPAVIFGGAAFFLLQKGNNDESSPFSFRKLPALLLLVSIIYGFTLTAILF